GPHLEEPAEVEARDRAAAGADRGQVDNGDGDRKAPLELVLLPALDLAAEHDPDIAARTAHVECEDVVATRAVGEVLAGDETTGEAGQDEIRRLSGGGARG